MLDNSGDPSSSVIKFKINEYFQLLRHNNGNFHMQIYLPLIVHCFTCFDIVVSYAFSLFQLDGLEKSFYSFYVCTAVRKFFFFLDPLRTGKKKS